MSGQRAREIREIGALHGAKIGGFEKLRNQHDVGALLRGLPREPIRLGDVLVAVPAAAELQRG